MNAGLRDQVAFVTGASGGIGAAVARALAAEGARLVLHAHTHIEAARRLAAELPDGALAVQADLGAEAEVDAAFARALAHHGQLDILVANAGIWPPEPAPVHTMELERWRRVLAVNQTGVFLCARAFFSHLAQRRPATSAVVIVGSTAGLFGEEGHAAYAASKAAITHGLVPTLKNEIVRLSPGGRVNAVCPGWTRTPMAAAGLADTEAVRDVLQTRSLRAIAEPEDVAAAVTYLASPRLARHVSGQILAVAGGMEGRLLHQRPGLEPAGP